jgi:hypothetical protein
VAARLVQFDSPPAIVHPAKPAPGAELPDLKEVMIHPDED